MPPSPVLASERASTCRAFSRPDDAELQALCNRDSDAIEKWICGCRGALYAYVVRYARDGQQAREMVQETIVRALEKLPSFRGDAKVSTWLYGIARNVALHRRRNEDRCTPVESDELEWLSYRNTDGPTQGMPTSVPDSRTEKAERRRRFYRALSELRPSYRQIIRLRDLEEKTTAETADELGLTEVNVRVRLHRARKKLRETLDMPSNA